MIKKLKYLVLITILLMMINVIPLYASETFYWNGVEIQEYNEESIILPKNIKQSRGIVNGQPRGSIISTAIVDITDELNGNVGLIVQTYAHVGCDKIIHAITLQKYDEANDDWITIERFEFEANQEEQPDKKLSYLVNGIEVKNLPSGIYRARGLHAVYLGEDYEGFSTRTHGITIRR